MPKRSKFDQLPDDTRTWVHGLIQASNFGDYDRVLEIIQERGLKLSRSGLAREGLKLQEYLQDVQAATEGAKAIATHAGDSEDTRSGALLAMCQTEFFNALIGIRKAAREDDGEVAMELLTKAAQGIAQLTRASAFQKRYAAEARKKALEEVAAEIAKAERESGKAGAQEFDLRTLQHIRERVYGLQPE